MTGNTLSVVEGIQTTLVLNLPENSVYGPISLVDNWRSRDGLLRARAAELRRANIFSNELASLGGGGGGGEHFFHDQKIIYFIRKERENVQKESVDRISTHSVCSFFKLSSK